MTEIPALACLTPEEHAQARELAERCFEQAKKWRRPYGKATVDMYLVGKLGELALASILSNLGLPLHRHFLNDPQTGKCDLECGKAWIECKTWSEAFWTQWGRCVARSQLPGMRPKVNCIAWLSVDENHRWITFHGWNLLSDLSCAPVVKTGKIINHQLPLDELRPPRLLYDRLHRTSSNTSTLVGAPT